MAYQNNRTVMWRAAAFSSAMLLTVAPTALADPPAHRPDLNLGMPTIENTLSQPKLRDAPKPGADFLSSSDDRFLDQPYEKLMRCAGPLPAADDGSLWRGC
jgi:hypothetical protein